MMPYKFPHRLFIYQNERFPLIVLLPATLAVTLSFFAIAVSLNLTNSDILKIILSVVAAITYLFHIRAIDEYRDYEHDTKYHESRPIQRHLISIDELRIIDYFSLIIFGSIAIFYGLNTFLMGVIALAFSFVAGKDFFLGEVIRKKFFTYNAVNFIQTILLQIFIYSIFIQSWYSYPVLLVHLLLVLNNSMLLEFVRKIKIKEEESSGKDTYSWHLGFSNSLYVYTLLVLTNFAVFVWILSLMNLLKIITLSIAAFSLVIIMVTIAFHLKKENKYSEQFLLLNTAVFYIVLHLIIYFSLT